MLVGWKVNSLAANMASVRYRALLPAAALEPAGVRSRVFSDGAEAHLDGLDVLVIVKSFTPDDLRLAHAARARGIRVIFDLCDNVFIEGYAGRGPGLSVAEVFVSIAGHAHCVVTTTQPLAEVVRARLPCVPVVVIADGIESSALAAGMSKVLRDAKALEQVQAARILRQRVGNALRRVRSEGVGVIPSLVGAAARRVRHRIHARIAPPMAVVESIPEQPGRQPGLQPDPQRQRIVWFGNHGAAHGRFGMVDILEYRPALEALARERQVELVVISNNRARFDELIRPLAIPTRYVAWGPGVVERWLRDAAAVIVPNTLDAFSICKSANRTVLALASGVPVVATMTPALHPLADFIHTGDPLTALRSVLVEPQRARAQALDGSRRAEALFGTNAIQAQWLRLLTDLLQAPQPEAGVLPQPFLAVVLHLVQDLDLALPILKEARSTGLSAEAWCSAKAFGQSPRVVASLQREAIPFRLLPEGDAQLKAFTFAASTRVLLTVAETSMGPHRVPRLLSEAAARQGLFVATLQHGFENVGLTYEDAIAAIDRVTIAAQRIYTWGPAHTLHPKVSASVRARCVPVGCPKEAKVPPADLQGRIPAGRPVVGIFENLHWHRYSDAYRGSFLQAVDTLARTYPQVFFLVKPHHAGVWLSQRYEGERPNAGNLLIADPQAPEWEHYTAGALLPHLCAVITTPSTVALDAARMKLPVAVVASGLDLDNYRPLPLLAGVQDWLDFVRDALEAQRREPLREQAARFVDRVLVPGNAARRIVQDLREAVGA